jgi:hypothetical protein
MTAPDNHSVLLAHIGKLEGQLAVMTQLMQQNHESTHQRINDFRHAIEGRITGVEARVVTLEGNERSTAIKAAGGGALSGALATAALKLIEYIATR